MELEQFDWDVIPSLQELYKPQPPVSRWDVARMKNSETRHDRCLRMLRQLSLTCKACTMCELGRRDAQKDYIVRDPHVLSNLNPSRFVIVGQNPGWRELELCEPFVGASGDNFNKQVEKHGLSRDDFYITNAVKCWTQDNSKPNLQHAEACKPFLQMELQLLRPLLVIVLGASAFDMMCPNHKFSDRLQKITRDEVFPWPVYAAYHPSPMNMTNKGRKEAFEKQVAILCKLVKKMKLETHYTE